ncbi:uncharacterized protein LOC120186289 [Hibiscus syriacus]|uniref:uncharacterized protein LOC120186289 n=1 Tax=Hibiscus syriacus TaxID=106335 RepID=UPI001923F9E6|nr:uncharacterized protein LOC120186289 [Hibiscus syriacus]
MGWNHPDISLDEMMKLIKGFVDILILASGYQSSGLLAHWDSDNINRAFQWALFFENVFRRLSCLDVYQESIVELDAALFEMTSHPAFPQGLAQLSSATLRRARSFLLEHLLHTLPLRDSHLQAVLTAIIEVDLSDPSQTEHDCLNAYLNDLTLQNRICMRDNSTFSDVTPTLETENFTKLAVHELFGRQSSVSCILIIEEGVNVLSNAVKNNGWKDSDCSLYGEPMNHEIVPTLLPIADELVDFVTWKQWKSRALSYFLDKRTIRLVSGASLIFSGANEQWRKIFGQLNISEKSSENDLYETIELLLLGSIASRWNCIIEHLMSVSYDSVTISKQYHVLANSVFEISQSNQTEEIKISKEGGILDYLTRLLGGQIHLLWKSSPALAAVSLTFWPTLFRVYLSEIELQFKGKPSMIRCCNCIQDSNEHKDCELAERIWCLYIFHVCGSQIIRGGGMRCSITVIYHADPK